MTDAVQADASGGHGPKCKCEACGWCQAEKVYESLATSGRVGTDPRVTPGGAGAGRAALPPSPPSTFVLLPVSGRQRRQGASRSALCGLCLLDPYGLSVDWKVLEAIGKMKSVEVFLNFMVVGANRNVLWTDPAKVPPGRAKLMDRIWGDGSWREAAYRQERTLFEPVERKVSNETLMEAYRQRLIDVAGFKYVPAPIPMKNTQNATIYYLLFASPNSTGAKIVGEIFRRHARI